MAARTNPQQPSNRTLRQGAWILAISLALVGQLLGPSLPAFWLELAGAAIFAVGTVRPSAFRPLLTFAVWLFRRISALLIKSNDNTRPPISTSRRGQVANTGA